MTLNKEQKERKRKYNAKYAKEHKEVYSNGARKYAHSNRKKINAKAAANYHIKIPKGQICQFLKCKELAEIKHHEDYDKPLVVKFYCKKHHYFIHRNLAGDALIDNPQIAREIKALKHQTRKTPIVDDSSEDKEPEDEVATTTLRDLSNPTSDGSDVCENCGRTEEDHINGNCKWRYSKFKPKEVGA